MRISILAVVASLSTIAFAETTPQQCIAHDEKSIELRADHKLQQSREELLQCALAACPAEIRGECEKRLVTVNAELPTVVVFAKDPSGGDLIDVRITIDGARTIDKLDGAPITLDPGAHVFRFETSKARTEARILVREGEKDRPIRVTIGEQTAATPETRKSPAFRIAGASIASLGLAGVIAGAIFGGLASSAWSSSQSECSTSSCPNRAQALSDHDTAVTFATISTIGFVAGGVAIAAGGAIFFFAPTVTRDRATLSVAARF